MRIFAKRGRNKTTKASADSAEKEKAETIKVFQSDPVVEELLKQIPKTWNSKQRRMVKRYQQRQQQNDSNSDADYQKACNNDDGIDEAELKEQPKKRLESGHTNKSKESDAGDSPESDIDEDSASSSSPSSESRDDGKAHKKDEQDEKFSSEVEMDELNVAVNKDDEPKTKEVPTLQHENQDTTSVSSEAKARLEAILANLNSKERRKITRKFDRSETTIEQALQEAKSLLQEKADKHETPNIGAGGDDDDGGAYSRNKKRKAENHNNEDAPESSLSSSLQPSKKKWKRKKQTADFSSLSPEECMRREEQRRLQKEAAERREKGLVWNHNTRHCHPLNSERRRANRRKPKWAKRPLPKQA